LRGFKANFLEAFRGEIMNIFALISLISFVTIIHLVNLVYFENRKNPINRLFAFLCVSEACLAFFEFMARQSETPSTALFWLNLSCLWPIVISITYHFVLKFTGSKLLKHKLGYVFLYVPAVVCSILFYNSQSGSIPVKEYWGHTLIGIHDQNWPFYTVIIWSQIFIILTLTTIMVYYLKLKPGRKKVQAKFMCLAFLIPSVSAILTHTIPELFNIRIPGFMTLSMTGFTFIIVYSMHKYKLFSNNTTIAADNIIATMSDLFVLSNVQGYIVLVNQAVINLLGYQRNELEGLTVDILLGEKSFKELYWEKTSAGENISNYEVVFKTKNGDHVWVSFSSSVIRDEDSATAGIVWIARDIAKTRKMVEKITYQATHDSLTDLANRNYFEEQLKLLVSDAKGLNQHHALFYLDLDHFKIVNDTCGHFVGDQLLREISSLMKQRMRKTDIVARLGGDEFGVLLKNCPMNKAVKIAEKLCLLIRNYHFTWNERAFNIGVSIGVVGIDLNSRDAGKILTMADRACYIVKARGGNNVYSSRNDDLESNVI
jgi:diguanylate cyclase (GGDEF)-like protein/PAS domain S-box-containing protein